MQDENAKEYSLLLVEDHLIVSQGVELILDQHFDIEKIDIVTNGQQFIKKINEALYDLIIIDINLPDTDTYKVIKEALTTFPNLRILVFSMHPEEIYMKRFMKLGVYGYFNKNEDKEELIKAVTAILAGKKYFSQKSLQIIAEELKSGKPFDNPFEKLSQREFEILRHLLIGLRIKEISNLTNLHSSTVGTQKQRMFQKLGVKNMKELSDLAMAYNYC